MIFKQKLDLKIDNIIIIDDKVYFKDESKRVHILQLEIKDGVILGQLSCIYEGICQSICAFDLGNNVGDLILLCQSVPLSRSYNTTFSHHNSIIKSHEDSLKKSRKRSRRKARLSSGSSQEEDTNSRLVQSRQNKVRGSSLPKSIKSVNFSNPRDRTPIYNRIQRIEHQPRARRINRSSSYSKDTVVHERRQLYPPQAPSSQDLSPMRINQFTHTIKRDVCESKNPLRNQILNHDQHQSHNGSIETYERSPQIKFDGKGLLNKYNQKYLHSLKKENKSQNREIGELKKLVDCLKEQIRCNSKSNELTELQKQYHDLEILIKEYAKNINEIDTEKRELKIQNNSLKNANVILSEKIKQIQESQVQKSVSLPNQELSNEELHIKVQNHEQLIDMFELKVRELKSKLHFKRDAEKETRALENDNKLLKQDLLDCQKVIVASNQTIEELKMKNQKVNL